MAPNMTFSDMREGICAQVRCSYDIDVSPEVAFTIDGSGAIIAVVVVTWPPKRVRCIVANGPGRNSYESALTALFEQVVQITKDIINGLQNSNDEPQISKRKELGEQASAAQAVPELGRRSSGAYPSVSKFHSREQPGQAAEGTGFKRSSSSAGFPTPPSKIPTYGPSQRAKTDATASFISSPASNPVPFSSSVRSNGRAASDEPFAQHLEHGFRNLGYTVTSPTYNLFRRSISSSTVRSNASTSDPFGFRPAAPLNRFGRQTVPPNAASVFASNWKPASTGYLTNTNNNQSTAMVNPFAARVEDGDEEM